MTGEPAGKIWGTKVFLIGVIGGDLMGILDFFSFLAAFTTGDLIITSRRLGFTFSVGMSVSNVLGWILASSGGESNSAISLASMSSSVRILLEFFENFLVGEACTGVFFGEPAGSSCEPFLKPTPGELE